MLAEYTDERGRLLLLAPPDGEAGPLRRKMAGVLVLDTEGRLFVRCPSGEGDGPGRWDISAVTSVRAGESREDAAERALGVAGISLAELPGGAVPSGKEAVFTLFRCLVPVGTPDFPYEAGTFLDQDELLGLAEEVPELLTPVLLEALRNGLPWKSPLSTR